MGAQSFGFSEGDGGGADLAQRGLSARHPRGAFQKVEDRQAGCEPRGAAGGENVVGTSHVIAQSLGAVRAEEDGAGVADLAE